MFLFFWNECHFLLGEYPLLLEKVNVFSLEVLTFFVFKRFIFALDRVDFFCLDFFSIERVCFSLHDLNFFLKEFNQFILVRKLFFLQRVILLLLLSFLHYSFLCVEFIERAKFVLSRELSFILAIHFLKREKVMRVLLRELSFFFLLEKFPFFPLRDFKKKTIA